MTDSLVKLKDPEWNIALKRLGEVELLNVTRDAIEAHPLIREYFAKQLRDTQPAAFQAAHSRLFDHLCETTEYRPGTLDGLQPLYEAVVNGCLAGRQQEACDKVYSDRILRGTGSAGNYSSFRLGAIGADLAAVAAFFDEPWSRVSPNLREADQAWLLNEAAYNLRALGRLTEALQPMRAGLEMRVQQKNWKSAAIMASNLSELELTLGRLTEAAADARRSITHADQSGDASANGQTRHGGGCLRPVRPASRSRLALRRSRTDAKGKAAAVRHALLAGRLPLLRLAPGPRRTAAWQALLRGTGSQSVMDKHGEDGAATFAMKSNGVRTTTLKWAIDARKGPSSPSPSIT